MRGRRNRPRGKDSYLKKLLTLNYKIMTKIGKAKFISCFSLLKLKLVILTGLLIPLAMVSTAAQLQSQRISLKLNNATVLHALHEINRISGNQVLFKNDEIQKETSSVTVDLKDITVLEAVGAVLRKSTNLSHTVKGDVIVVSPSAAPAGSRQSPPVQNTFKGTVKDQDGVPLVGATVGITGTSTGTVTDVNGFFSLNGRENDTEVKLVVSFVGFTTKYVTVKPNQNTAIVLESDVAVVSEVVVTGYQTIKRERMTGSVATITAAQIENKGFTNIEQVLNGTVSGLNFTGTGRPGQDGQILIRGANSLTGSTAPIWIVDGMPMQGDVPDISMSTDISATILTTGIGNIAPDDIRSINILKDAAATAIYGARAANGVIVIETKSGLEGKTRFSVSTNFGVTDRPSNNISMMNSAQKIQFEREILNDQNGNISTPGRVTSLLQLLKYQEITEAQANSEIARLSAINTDWFKEIFKPAFQQQYNFTMSGGDAKTQHYTSLNFLDQKGTEPNNAYSRATMSVKLTHNPSDKIRIIGGITGTMRNDRASASMIDPLVYAMYANPYERPYNDDGSYAYDKSWDPALSTLHDGLKWETLNAIEDMKRNTKTQRYLNLQLDGKLEWEIVKGLQFATSIRYGATSSNTRTVEGANTYTSFKNNWLKSYYSGGEIPLELVRGSLREGTGYSSSYVLRNTLQYSREFNEKHFLTLFAGQEIEGNKGYSSYNYYPIFDEHHRIGGYPEMTGIDGSVIKFNTLGGTGKTERKLTSFFGNASYSYMDKYILTGAVRYDGSDIIGNKNQFTPLWNVGARWNLHREEFLSDNSWINQLSLRAGFGYTGSIDNNALPFVTSTYGQSLYWDDQLIPTSYSDANYNVKWQTKQDFNTGLDISLFDHKLELGFNYYYNITRDVLDNWNLPYSSGRNVIRANVADIYNNGFEFDLGMTLLRNKDWRWYARFNVALNNSKVKNTFYKSIDDLPDVDYSTGTQYVEDYPAGSWFGYRYAGVDPISGYVLVYTGNGDAIHAMGLASTSTVQWATPKAYYLGKKIPPVTGGFSTTVSWKQLVMSASFEYKAGHKITSFNTYRALDSKNRHSVDANRWRQPGDITNIPMQSETYTSYSTYMFDTRLEKGDYLRCSYLNLGYNIQPSLLSAIGFSTARISFTANNLFALSKYRGIDPSLMGSTGYPVSRSYILTLNFGF